MHPISLLEKSRSRAAFFLLKTIQSENPLSEAWLAAMGGNRDTGTWETKMEALSRAEIATALGCCISGKGMESESHIRLFWSF